MEKKKRKKKKHILLKLFFASQILLMLLVIAAIGFYYFSGYGTQITQMQQSARAKVDRSSEETFRSVETSLVYDANGEQISKLNGEKDVFYLDFEEIPSYATAAIVSIEDKKFYQHPGYDYKAILRAAKAFLEEGEVTQGGSTITQQLARNIFLSHERSWQRKVEEIFIAVELEKIYSKNKILEFYLNNVYFANGYYGIQAASKGYFNKEVQELTLSQIAFLCAIPNNPSLYDPMERIQETLKRRDRILKQMREDGKISRDTCLEAMTEEITLNQPEKTKHDYVETYIYYCATRALMEQQGFRFQTEFQTEEEKEGYQQRYQDLFASCQASLYQKGYRIYTSIDLELQKELQDTVDFVLSGHTETNEEGVYTLQSSAVCLDNITGMVKAIVGGRNQNLAGYTLNRAYQSFRQPGSAIKPLIVYTPILEGAYTPDSLIVDEEIEDGPRNADGYYAGEITLRTAVEKSKNTTAWKLFEELTPTVGLSYLKKMGFTRLSSEDERLPSALGGFTNGVSALEMASAYGTIANSGMYRAPTCISSITDAEGNIIYEPDLEGFSVYKENAAWAMTDILKTTLIQGTGAGLGLSSMDSAGKTGTTNDNKDGWFVGYTRYYTTSVWVGFDMPKELPGLTGSSYPGKIWNRFMESIHKDLPPLSFLPYIKQTLPETLSGETSQEAGEVLQEEPFLEEQLQQEQVPGEEQPSLEGEGLQAEQVPTQEPVQEEQAPPQEPPQEEQVPQQQPPQEEQVPSQEPPQEEQAPQQPPQEEQAPPQEPPQEEQAPPQEPPQEEQVPPQEPPQEEQVPPQEPPQEEQAPQQPPQEEQVPQQPPQEEQTAE